VKTDLRSPAQLAREALRAAMDEGLIQDFAVRRLGRATIYLLDGGKVYTDHLLDTLLTLKRLGLEP
jgi:hypothetical protein